MIETKQRLVISALVVALVAVLVWLGIVIARPQANVLIKLAPSNAQLTLDGQKTIGGGSQYIKPGKHELVATLTGFANSRTSFTLETDQPLEIRLVLNPNSAAGYQLLENNPDQELLREELGGQRFDNAVTLQKRLYPITQLLPFNGLGFAVDYGQPKKSPDDASKIALYISVTDQASKTRALNWIKYNGYDPANYEIIYDYLHAH